MSHLSLLGLTASRTPASELSLLSGPASFAPRPSPSAWSLVVGLLALVLHGSSAQAATIYELNEKFNAMATGSAPASPWTTVSTGGGSVTVQEEGSAASKSVRIQKLKTSGTSS